MTLNPTWPVDHDEASRDTWGAILLAGLGQTVAAVNQLGVSPTAVKSSAYTAAVSDFVPVDATSANRTVTLPTAPANNSRIGVKVVAVGSGKTVTVACGGSDVIDKAGGSATLTLDTVNEAVLLQYNAALAVWYVAGHSYSKSGLAAAVAGAYVPLSVPASAAQAPRTVAPTDQSTLIQAAIDALATTGGVVRLPPGWFYGSFKMRPNVDVIGSGWRTCLAAMPGQTADVVEYATYNAYHTLLRDLRVDGNYLYNRTDGATQGACKGINVTTNPGSGAGAFIFNWSGWGSTVPVADGSAYNTEPGRWNDAINSIERVHVTNIGGSHGIFVGPKELGCWMDRVWVFDCAHQGIEDASADSMHSNVQVGACSDGILVTGATQHWTNCKAWYAGRNPAYSNGSGDGWKFASSGAFTASLVNCESQDNNRYGWNLDNCQSLRMSACLSGGDTTAMRLGNARSGDIDLKVAQADLANDVTGILFDTTGGVQADGCRIRWTTDLATFATGFTPLAFASGATTFNNDVEGPGTQHGVANVTAFPSGGLTPGSRKTFFGATWTGALNVNAPSPEIGSTGIARGEDLTVILYDATGGHAVTWDAAYHGAEGFTTTAGKYSMFRFMYMGGGAYVLINTTNDGTAKSDPTNWKTLPQVSCSTRLASGAGTSTYLMLSGVGALAVGSASTYQATFYLDPADYAVAGRTTKLRVRATCVTNAVAPAANFTATLSPVSSFGGASGADPTVTAVGTSVASVTFTAPGAASATPLSSSAVAFPAAGFYVLTVTPSVAPAANSATAFTVEAQVQQV